MDNIDKLRFYSVNGPVFTTNQRSGFSVAYTAGIFILFIVAGAFGLYKLHQANTNFLCSLTIIMSIRSILLLFTRTEIDVSTKLITEIKLFGLKKRIKRIDEFTEFTFMSWKYLWVIPGGYTGALNFKDKNGLTSRLYTRVAYKQSDLKAFFDETLLVLRS